MSFRSLLVSTATTPGIDSASAVSIERMRACAYGLRKNFPSTIPGIDRSATYLALPVTLAAPWIRGTDWPTTVNVFCILSIRKNGSSFIETPDCGLPSYIVQPFFGQIVPLVMLIDSRARD